MQLNRALYGLKQASRKWYETITKFLIEKAGWTQSSADSCLFMKREMRLILYVDDMLISGPDQAEVQRFVQELAIEYKIKDLGEADFVLGVALTPTSDDFRLF